jgi:hypothetical protein
LVEQSDEWLVGGRYLSAESLALVLVDEDERDTSERRCLSSSGPELPTSSPTSVGYTTGAYLILLGAWVVADPHPLERPGRRFSRSQGLRAAQLVRRAWHVSGSGGTSL